MSRYYHTQAITLNKHEIGEYDMIYHVYTQDHGKVSALVTSGRKIISRLSSHLESFGIVELGVVNGFRKNIITHAVGSIKYLNIINDLEAIHSAGFALRLVNKLVKEGVNDSKIFDLLKSFLEILNIGTENNKRNLSILNSVFTLKLLSFLGYTPELKKCLHCKQEVSRGLFSFELGGVVCERCKKPKDATEVTVHDVAFLRKSINIGFSDVIKETLSQQQVKKINTLISKFLMYHLS